MAFGGCSNTAFDECQAFVFVGQRTQSRGHKKQRLAIGGIGAIRREPLTFSGAVPE
jgi:hypothetical protein